MRKCGVATVAETNKRVAGSKWTLINWKWKTVMRCVGCSFRNTKKIIKIKLTLTDVMFRNMLHAWEAVNGELSNIKNFKTH